MGAEPVAPHQPSTGASLAGTGTEYLGFCIETILVEGCFSHLFWSFVIHFWD